MNPNIHNFIACESAYHEANVILFGAPFDGTSSNRPGSRFAPAAIRTESYGLETYSPYCGRDLTDCMVFDAGDLELPFGNAERALELIWAQTARILADDKLPFLLGGEHLVSLGAVRALREKYPDLHVIHLDAHTDLRNDYLGEELSHATVMRQIWKLLGDGRIHQFGIRSGERHEFEFAHAHCDIHPFTLEDFPALIEQLRGKPVYFTLDLDVLDPSVFCGTGTPEPGGVDFHELLALVLQLGELHIVGCDVNELSPHYDQSGTSTAVAAKIIREMILQLKGEEKYG